MDWEIYERWEPDSAEEASEAVAESEVITLAYGLILGETEAITPSHEQEGWFTEWSIGHREDAID